MCLGLDPISDPKQCISIKEDDQTHSLPTLCASRVKVDSLREPSAQHVVLQYQIGAAAMQEKLQTALKQQQTLQEQLDKEKATLRASLASAADSHKDATWKKKLMNLRAELDGVKQERDSYKRQCIR